MESHMTTSTGNGWSLDRRTFLKGTTAAAAAAAVPGVVAGRDAMAQDRASTLVLASPATPQSLDSEYDVSLGTFESVAACYDSLVEFEKPLMHMAPVRSTCCR